MTLEIRGLNIIAARALRDQVNKFCFGHGICEVDIDLNGYYENLSDVIISTSNILISDNIIYISDNIIDIFKNRSIRVNQSKYRFIDIRIKM